MNLRPNKRQQKQTRNYATLSRKNLISIITALESKQTVSESEAMFHVFAENISEIIWIASSNLDKLYYLNNTCKKILSIDSNTLRKELVRWKEIVHPDDIHLVNTALQEQQQGLAVELEIRIIRHEDKLRWIRIRSFPATNRQGQQITTGIIEEISHRKQFEIDQIDRMLQQRNNLVREVHHRIKNNLQGVSGLLRQKADQYPALGPIIDQAISQIRTVAVVHGLHGQKQDSEVVLCEMVPAIVKTVEALLSPRVEMTVCVDVPQRIRVTEAETVSIALILNELIMNAAKHAINQHESTPPKININVSWRESSKQAIIHIENPGLLPDDFAFSAAKGLGTGLDLVRALLPPSGGMLTIFPGNGQIIALLELSSPCIYNI